MVTYYGDRALITKRWPSVSATEHLRCCVPLMVPVLQTAGYSDQFGVNPEIATTLITVGAKRSDVELVSSVHLLDVGTYESPCEMAIGGATTGSFFTRLVFPVFQPRGLARRGLRPSGSTTCVFDICHLAK